MNSDYLGVKMVFVFLVVMSALTFCSGTPNVEVSGMVAGKYEELISTTWRYELTLETENGKVAINVSPVTFGKVSEGDHAKFLCEETWFGYKNCQQVNGAKTNE